MNRIALSLAVSFAVSAGFASTGCGEANVDGGGSDGGGDACAAGQVCDRSVEAQAGADASRAATEAGATCTPQCAGMCSGPDGCGGNCPDNCQAPAICGGGAVATACAVPNAALDCALPWGGSIHQGQSATAYASSSVECGATCSSQKRSCNNKALSGSFVHASCSVKTCASCDLPWGGSVAHGESVTAHASSGAGCGDSCASEQRTCSDGVLSGSYNHDACSQSCDLVPDVFSIPPVVDAAPKATVYSQTITVTGLDPFISVYCTATNAGYVSAGPDAISGTYGSKTPSFLTSAAGTLVFRVMSWASNTPGETVVTTIGVKTSFGYGATYIGGPFTQTTFSVTTKSP